jgi:hypothetical protein
MGHHRDGQRRGERSHEVELVFAFTLVEQPLHSLID